MVDPQIFAYPQQPVPERRGIVGETPISFHKDIGSNILCQMHVTAQPLTIQNSRTVIVPV